MKRKASPVSDNQAPKRFEIYKSSRANGHAISLRTPQQKESPHSPTESDRAKKRRHRARFPKSLNHPIDKVDSLEKTSSEVVLVTLDGTRIKSDRASACSFSFVQAGEQFHKRSIDVQVRPLLSLDSHFIDP